MNRPVPPSDKNNDGVALPGIAPAIPLVGVEAGASGDGASFADEVEAALDHVLVANPGAMVGAVPGDVPTSLVPLPEGLCLPRPCALLTERSLADVVSRRDRGTVARLWWQAREAGSATAVVTSARDEALQLGLTLFDLRERFGVLAAVVVEGAAAAAGSPPLPERQLAASRFGRVVKDGTATILDADAAALRMLGLTRDQYVGRRSVEFIHPGDRDLAVEQWVRMSDLSGATRSVRLRHRTGDGRWLWVEITNHNRIDDPRHGDVVTEMVDVSEEIAAQDAARARQQLLEQITETVPVGLLHADLDGRLLYANYRLTETTGLRVGLRLEGWPLVASVEHRAGITEALATALSGTATETVVEVRGAFSEPKHYLLRLLPLVDETGTVTGTTGSVEDVTEQVVERRELEIRAATDALTGCLNRAGTMSTIQDALRRLADEGESTGGLAVIFVDVDNLKEVNDHRGHATGDALLVEVASRLRAAVRSRDAVGRFGGDEFVVVAHNMPEPDFALRMAHSVAAYLMRPFSVEGRSVPIRASFGVAWSNNPLVQSNWLLRQADAAMYSSKRGGRCEPVLAA